MGGEVKDLKEDDEEAALGAVECTFSFRKCGSWRKEG